MSVAITARIDYRSGSAFADPGLPAGVWWGDAAIEGDASAGFASVQLLFQLSTVPFSARMFTLEAMGVTINAAVATVCRINTTNMGILVVGRPMTARPWIHAMLSDGITNSALPTGLPTRPVWLGPPSDRTLTSDLRADVPNPGAGVTLRFFASGFMWEPGALNAPGGVRRPLENIFGA